MLDIHLLFGEKIPKASERLKLICFVYGGDGLDKHALKDKYLSFHLPEIKNWSRDFSNLKASTETFAKGDKVFYLLMQRNELLRIMRIMSINWMILI